MAWRKPTEADIAATLSQKELDLYRQSSAADGSDPVADLLSRTAEMVRGYCRANKAVRLSPVEGTIPDSLVSPAMDYAAYDVLKRQAVNVGEDRRRAREQAVALFEKVANGAMTPESGVDGEDSTAAASPLAGQARPPRLLD